MTLIDTNYILRWFFDDVHEQTEIAQQLFENAPGNTLRIDRLIIAEVTFVLRSRGYNHPSITTLIRELYLYEAIVSPTAVEDQALHIYASTSLDYEDCYLIADAILSDGAVASFDKQLLKTLQKL